MGKDKSEKKEKKEKRSEKDGVKKSKKDKKSKLSDENLVAAFEEATKEVEKPVVETKALVVQESSGEVVVKPVGALVPFANPLADEKVTKKVLKTVKKGTNYRRTEPFKAKREADSTIS
jgi:H/ACA ribonucleoprotein complex subunit 2